MNANPKAVNERRFGERICYLKKRQAYGELVNYLKSALASGDMSPELQAKSCNEMGLAHLQLDNPAEAERAFERAVEHAPYNVNPRFNKANLALYAQQYDRALKLYQEILTIDPDHVGSRYHAGLCYAMTNKIDTALPYFESSAAADPSAMGPHFWAGESLLHSKEFSRALPYFRRAVEITPNHPESQRGAAICLYELEDFPGCITHCDTLIAAGGGAEFMALSIKGDALLELRETEKAAQCHLDMVSLDFDAREFLIRRAKRLAHEDSSQLAEYAAIILAHIPELEPSLTDIWPEANSNKANHQLEQISQ